jgi:hypothetical protein
MDFSAVQVIPENFRLLSNKNLLCLATAVRQTWIFSPPHLCMAFGLDLICPPNAAWVLHPLADGFTLWGEFAHVLTSYQ